MTNNIERQRNFQNLFYVRQFLQRSPHPAAGSQEVALEWALAQLRDLYPADHAAAEDLTARRARPKGGTTP